MAEPITILLNAEGQIPEAARARRGDITKIGALPHGMASGKASVAIVGRLADGTHVLLETSLRLLLDAATVLSARYGIEADGKSPPKLDDATRDMVNAAIMIKLVRDREGGEVTLDVDEINAIMNGPLDALEVVHGADGKTLTLRTQRSE